MQMNDKPEGWRIDTPENRAAMQSPSALADACREERILEARAIVCDSAHNLITDLGCMKGIIPREEGAIGIQEGTVRDIAIISRVNRPVCFVIKGFRKDPAGKTVAVLSRREAQERCQRDFISQLVPGDVIDTRVTHLESFGAFADIGCGIVRLPDRAPARAPFRRKGYPGRRQVDRQRTDHAFSKRAARYMGGKCEPVFCRRNRRGDRPLCGALRHLCGAYA